MTAFPDENEYRMPNTYVYVAGAYGDHDDYCVIEARINRARAHCAELARAGIPFYSPHLNCAHFQFVTPDVGRDFWKKQDDAFLEGASHMLVISKEADKSKGTQAEIEQAHATLLPVFYTETIHELIADWKEQEQEDG